MKKSLKLFALALYVLSASAFAEDAALNVQTCLDANNTVEMMDCFKSKIDQSENNIKHHLKNLKICLAEHKNTVKTTTRSLIRAQKAWDRYRQAQCLFIRDKGEGTIASIDVNICYLNLTEERAQYLKKTYQECVNPESALNS